MLELYCIYDSKAEQFLGPYPFKNAGVAVRWFAAIVNDATSDISKFPEDYCLYSCGSFDPEKGTFAVLESPKSVVMANMLKDKEVK